MTVRVRPGKIGLSDKALKILMSNEGPIFSHTAMVLQAAIHGQGVALAHNVMARPDINSGRLMSRCFTMYC